MDHTRFMQKALALAQDALNEGEFPVGAVLVSGGKVVAEGFRKGSSLSGGSETDHAEMRALARFSPPEGQKPADLTLYSTMEPCLMCLGAAIICGVKTIVYAYEDVMGGGACCDFDSLTPLYKNAGVKIIPHVLRGESLALFKQFFENPQNAYLKDSLLARHTLAQ